MRFHSRNECMLKYHFKGMNYGPFVDYYKVTIVKSI
jgi:hypothetical protein